MAAPDETPILGRPDNLYGELHLYAQAYWHGEAAVVGTRKGLESLRAAIDDALLNGASASEEVYASDGEGYMVLVNLVDAETMGRMVMPYTDDAARDERAGALDFSHLPHPPSGVKA